jgi:hypothetical protein
MPRPDAAEAAPQLDDCLRLHRIPATLTKHFVLSLLLTATRVTIICRYEQNKNNMAARLISAQFQGPGPQASAFTSERRTPQPTCSTNRREGSVIQPHSSAASLALVSALFEHVHPANRAHFAAASGMPHTPVGPSYPGTSNNVGSGYPYSSYIRARFC